MGRSPQLIPGRPEYRILLATGNVVARFAAGNMIELVVIVADDDRHIVIHAMPARPNFLALLTEPGDPT